jgi:hypothetical protein
MLAGCRDVAGRNFLGTLTHTLSHIYVGEGSEKNDVKRETSSGNLWERAQKKKPNDLRQQVGDGSKVNR